MPSGHLESVTSLVVGQALSWPSEARQQVWATALTILSVEGPHRFGGVKLDYHWKGGDAPMIRIYVAHGARELLRTLQVSWEEDATDGGAIHVMARVGGVEVWSVCDA